MPYEQPVAVREDPETSTSSQQSPRPSTSERPRVRGKFLYVGDQKLYVRGVTYGPFNPEPHGSEYHNPAVVERDFERMREKGINTVRVYTVPPSWVLDLAEAHDLYLMIGLPWAQHIAFLDEEGQPASIEKQVREGVRACAGHPSVLCYAIGNEIPPSIVRWHGRKRVSRFLRRLYRAAKEEDEEALVTYVNYPTTEYLQLPFLDFASFNVYLENRDQLVKYLAHLHHQVGERPLVLAEVGLDSQENGLDAQARSLNWQIETIFQGGAAGAVVFSWTDEWYRGGQEIEEWRFGLTTRDRSEKPALKAVANAFNTVPAQVDDSWPSISVVICSYNGADTIGKTLEHTVRLRYPNYEVIVVDDGSTDRTPEIVGEYPVRHVRTENQGLSSARNTGWRDATGDIVAYLDDDAYPDPDWLTYLATAFRERDYAGVGGPNLPPQDVGGTAECIGRAPGNPKAVLVSEREAEHIPGCNMAFWTEALRAVDGFDPQFRVAGDDVDLCWRLLNAGKTLGYHPGAIVWHHPRSTVGGFWKQQSNYGRAEALLEKKWPSKYNAFGHSQWNGRVYADSRSEGSWLDRWRIYYGQWGQALFQPLYASSQGLLTSLPRMPEWYLLVGTLGILTAGGWFVTGLAYVAPVFVLAIGLPLVYASAYGYAKVVQKEIRWSGSLLWRFLTVSFLYGLQAAARLIGRIREGLTPWRQFDSEEKHGLAGMPQSRQRAYWSEEWESADDRLTELERLLGEGRTIVRRGGPFDRWDLEAREGPFATVRLLMAIEEHGGGAQLVRLRSWPRLSGLGATLFGIPALISGALALAGAWPASLIVGTLSLLIGLGAIRDCNLAEAAVEQSARTQLGAPIS